MGSFAKKLQKFEKTFKTAKQRAEEEGGFGVELPDGKYKAVLSECTLGEAQSSGRLQVGFAFKVTAGEAKGETARKYQAVETEDDQVWLARDLRRFGIGAPENGKDLEEIVEILNEAKPELVISVRTKDSGSFVYIDKVTSEIDAGKFADEDDGGDGDDGDDDDKEKKGKKGKDADDDADDNDADDSDADDDADGDDDADKDDEVAVEVGMEVKFVSKSGKNRQGKIIKILEADESVKVEDEDEKVYTVKLEDLELVEKQKSPKAKVHKK
jgi:hypothetical protein